MIRYSTFEVTREKIGSVGSMGAAETIFNELERVEREAGASLAFRDCRHVNRATTTKREDYNPSTMEKVTVVSDVHTGGSLATYAYQYMNNPIVTKYIKVPKGIGIGQTFIGMYINHVRVPLRISVKKVGEAIVTITTLRLRKIGEERAEYE